MIKIDKEGIAIRGSNMDLMFELTVILDALKQSGIKKDDIEYSVELAFKSTEELHATLTPEDQKLVDKIMEEMRGILNGI